MKERRRPEELPGCVYSPAVGCQWGGMPPGQRRHCEKCGWDPKVSRARRERLREKEKLYGK